ncbi:Structural maintenance of chromosomes protein 6 [Homalodisca vitripennis]|nr:Structural maintenance of chromosomes protein 6 [Homalodisca vitripennis]
MDNMVKDAREKVQPAREDFTNKKEIWNNYIKELNETKQSLRLARRKYDSCMAEIENLTKNAPEIKQRQESLKRQITEYEQKLQSIKAAEMSFEHDRQQLKDTVEQVAGTIEAMTSRWDNIQRQKRKREENLKMLSRNASSLSVYGEGVVNIVDEINKAVARRKFEKKPIGPLGLHIKVKDSVWSGAVENFLSKSILTAFCVDNNRDASVLSGILKYVCERYKIPQPSIFCSKFLPNRGHGDLSLPLILRPVDWLVGSRLVSRSGRGGGKSPTLTLEELEIIFPSPFLPLLMAKPSNSSEKEGRMRRVPLQI